jgi:putative transcriptional regulator
MKKQEFDDLIEGLEDALSYAKGDASSGAREHKIMVDRTFVAATRLKAGLTQEEFAMVTGASLGTVRKWERGERTPSGAAGMLVRILAVKPDLVIREAGIRRPKTARPRRPRAA